MAYEHEGPVGEVSVDKWLRNKIVHVLSIFPIISPTMLQVGVGPSISPKLWRPVLTNMITEGIVREERISAENPEGQVRGYTRYMLMSTRPIRG